MNVQFRPSKRDKTRLSLLQNSIRNMHSMCCSSAHCWSGSLICISFECISAFSDGCNSCMWTLPNEYLKCSVEKSHFRVQWLFGSCESGQPWNTRPCKACLFNQFPYFQLLTLLLCMLLFFSPSTNVLNQFWVDQSWGHFMWLQRSWWELHWSTCHWLCLHYYPFMCCACVAA